METVLVLHKRLYPRIFPALVRAQLKHAGVVAIGIPAVMGALIALVGAVWAAVAGAGPAAMAIGALSPILSFAVGMCAVAVLAGDPIAEVQDATPVGFRAVQALRASLVLVGAVAGALTLFVPLKVLGLVPVDGGWMGVVDPAAGALVIALVAFTAVCSARSARSASFIVVGVWLFFALVWDPNVVSLAARRGAPLLTALVFAAGSWKALGVPGQARSKEGGRR